MVEHLIIIAVVYIPLIILTIFLLQGKGALFLAGYNTMSPKKRARYNMSAVCRFCGYLMLPLISFGVLMQAGVMVDIAWMTTVGIIGLILAVLGLLVGIVYVNKSKRFRNNNAAAEAAAGNAKAPMTTIIISVFITVALFAAVGVMFYNGEKDSIVNILDGGMEIKGMYGVSVDFSEISEISLIESSMSEIGAGRRTNGYGGFGTSLKGNFQSVTLGNILLFVKKDSSPTIHIAREGGSDIYLSFKDSEATRSLYYEIMTVFPAG